MQHTYYEDIPKKKKRPTLPEVFRAVYNTQKIQPEPKDDLIKQIREERLRMKLWASSDVLAEGTKARSKYHTVKFSTKKYGSVRTNTTVRLDDNVAGKVIDEIGFDPNSHIPFNQEISISRF